MVGSFPRVEISKVEISEAWKGSAESRPSNFAHRQVPKLGGIPKGQRGFRGSHHLLSKPRRCDERSRRLKRPADHVHVVPSLSTGGSSRHTAKRGRCRRRHRDIRSAQASSGNHRDDVCLGSATGSLYAVDTAVPLVAIALDVCGSVNSRGPVVRRSRLLPQGLQSPGTTRVSRNADQRRGSASVSMANRRASRSC